LEKEIEHSRDIQRYLE